jgi:hypothetical protein
MAIPVTDVLAEIIHGWCPSPSWAEAGAAASCAMASAIVRYGRIQNSSCLSVFMKLSASALSYGFPVRDMEPSSPAAASRSR